MSEFTDHQKRANQGARIARRRRRFPCPHCGEPLQITQSKLSMPTLREGYVECTNVDCGWRGSFNFALVSTHVESEHPNPDVVIPLSQRGRRLMQNTLERDQANRVSYPEKSTK